MQSTADLTYSACDCRIQRASYPFRDGFVAGLGRCGDAFDFFRSKANVYDPAFCNSGRQLGATDFHRLSWVNASRLLYRRCYRAAVRCPDLALGVVRIVCHTPTIMKFRVIVLHEARSYKLSCYTKSEVKSDHVISPVKFGVIVLRELRTQELSRYPCGFKIRS